MTTKLTSTPSIAIRLAEASDATAVRRLATLDSSNAPSSPMLLAELDGELAAAYGISDHRAVADPFVPTADVVDLLERHGAKIAA